uniref:Glutathione S-transferase kappa n=1 Tax=Rhabditophanes sp. KR3021 TaxID=114890 RepID=A0AC35UFC7_9BILA
MSLATKVTFYFDVISPYSYLAFESLQRYQRHGDFDLKIIPFYLGGVMKETGNKPPAMIPAKGKYMVRDLSNMADYWGMKITQPKDFFETAIKHGTLKAQRFLTSVAANDSSFLAPAAREFWQNIWVDQKSAHLDQDILDVAQRIGLKGALLEKILVDANSEQIKAVLLQNTTDAIKKGCFGAPWIVVQKGNEKEVCFFGSDRLPQILKIAGKEYKGPLLHLSSKL